MKMAKKRFYILLSVTCVYLTLAFCVPLFVTADPYDADFYKSFSSPSADNWFGTDKMGRDIFARTLYGAQLSLSTTLLLVGIIFVVGGGIGIISGYFGGRLDAVLMRIADIFVSFPGMALALAMAGMLGLGLMNAVIAIALVSWTKYARLSRSMVLQIKKQEYMYAAKLAGDTTGQIIFRYVIPATLPTLIITASSDVGVMMLQLAGFSFLGLGAQTGAIEWGFMLSEGRQFMEYAPWLMIFPGLAIFISVALFNLLGDSVRDVLDPKSL